MTNPFQEQFLKAGLIDDKRIKQAKKEKYQAQKQGKQNRPDEHKLAAQRAKAEQVERDRELNRKRQQQSQQKALNAQVKQLIEQCRLSREGGDLAYNFTDQAKVKRIYVNAQQQGQLSRGRLAIVKLGGQYELIPAEAAQRVRQWRPESLILLLDPEAEAEQTAQEDDPYAEFKVPDDLTW
ncbi:MAG: DUF2058 domain-containing protein [Gammaproteobacteria bacterium SHHR-1]|uniref:DUF2058 domain-containing protein n=1 Tax=Magnetovirga frankeli TaxID=947516 RepID=UPI001293E6EE|nr:DUF2058 domain-containing protein [gamma proteobacterium SS-5]